MKKQISLGTIIATTMPRSERRDAIENRQRILQVAEALFEAHGVTEVNMADIAKKAKVGKGTLYRRFANKAELCLALMDAQMREFQEAMFGRMRQMSAQGVPAMEQLDQFLHALVYFTDAHSPLLCVVQSEGLLQAEGEQNRPHFWLYMTVSGLLQTAVDQQEIPPNTDIAYHADALLAALHTSIFQFQRRRRGFSLERMSAGVRALAQGLKYQAHAKE